MAVAKTKSTPDFTIITKKDLDRVRTTFTFPDSGVTVRLEPLGMATFQAIQKAILKESPPPTPPAQEVDYGDGVKRTETNDADPDYEKALKRHTEETGLAVIDRLLALAKRRMEVEIDMSVVTHLREDMEAIGIPIEETDDRIVYLDHFCITTEDDAIAVVSYLMRRSQPTEEAVQEHIATFRSDV